MAYKPTITNISAFDAKNGTVVYFGWKGEQAFANELIIKNSATLEIVYDLKITTMKLRHDMDLSAGCNNSKTTGTFENGKLYQATLIVYDKNDNASTVSDSVSFWALSSPTFEITNSDILSGITTMSSLYLNFHYYQTEGEVLNEYQVVLLDNNNQILIQSSTMYGSSSDEYLEYRIEGLENLQSYYVRVNGTTANGLSITTGDIGFSVKYDMMGVGANVIMTGSDTGTVLLSSNYKITNANFMELVNGSYEIDSNADATAYYKTDEDEENTWIKLDSNQKVEFFDGFEFSKSFEIKVRLQSVSHGTCLNINNGTDSIVVSYKRYYVETEDTYYPNCNYYDYFEMITTYGNLKQRYTTPFLSDAMLLKSYYNLVIIHKNGTFKLMIA